MTGGRLLRSAVTPADCASANTDDVEVTDHDVADLVFPQSVASSGPTPSGVLLWTRVDPAAAQDDRPLSVQLGPADSDTFTESWLVDADRVDEQHDYSVRVDLDGRLDPDTEYRYRFVYDGVASRTGYCQTLPEPDASPETFRVGVLSCQDYQNGYYGALNHVADADLDLVLHLGDFIYNSAARQFTGPGSPFLPDRDIDLPSGNERAHSLADLRELYRVYLSTRPLQRVRETHTMIRLWDDHAVANNRYWDYDQDAPAAPDHPKGDDPESMRDLTAAGIRTFWEYTPDRVDYNPDASHLHDRFNLWRELRYGDLVSLLLTDERLFRSKAPCSDGVLPPWPPICSGTNDPTRTMLGHRQRNWFADRLTTAEQTWTVWGNEVLSMPFQVGVNGYNVYPNVDSWDGYAAERRLIRDAMAANDDTTFVTLTGDMHTTLAGYQRRRVPGIRAGESTVENERVGVEFMTPAITSVNLAEAMALDRLPGTAQLDAGLTRTISEMNPHFAYFDSAHWGYSVAEFTRDDCTFTTYAVDKTADPAVAENSILRRFRVPAGTTEITDVTDTTD